MRFLASCAAALLLAACATATPSAPSAPSDVTQPSAAAQSSTRQAQLLRAAGSANAPTRADIERAFGRPDVVRQEGSGAALTYRLETCALLLLFSSADGNTLRLTEAHPSVRGSGAAPSLEQCAAEAARRS